MRFELLHAFAVAVDALPEAAEWKRALYERGVLEAAERPGGAVATEELTLPGFRHDTYSAVYPAGVASPSWRGYEKCSAAPPKSTALG